MADEQAPGGWAHVRAGLNTLRETMLEQLEIALNDVTVQAELADHDVRVENIRRADNGVVWDLIDVRNKRQVTYVERMSFGSYLGSVRDWEPSDE